jgi:hypothetical protein
MAKKKYFIGGAVIIVLAVILSMNLIVVKNAYHLDENYTKIEKVTQFILKQDNNFTLIPDNHYLRVQFEKKLNKTNDILIYAKGNGYIEVYKKGAKTKIAEFQNITEGFYRVYLTYMTGTTDTFDLKSKGDIYYDYVVDPVITNISTGYNSTNTNVTNEIPFSHLATSNSSLKLYFPFDVNNDSSAKTYDYSNYSNDGTVLTAIFNQTGGYIGGYYQFNTSYYNLNYSSYIQLSNINWVSKSYWVKNDSGWKNIFYNGTDTFVNGVHACPDGMAYIDKLGGYCIDKYEASHSDANSTDVGSVSTATSRPDVLPWHTISQIDARAECIEVGKHLCTDHEWLGSANLHGQIYYLPSDLYVEPYGCNTNSRCFGGDSSCPTKNGSNCYSAEGVYDMVGNLIEWTNETFSNSSGDPCIDPIYGGGCFLNNSEVFVNSPDGCTKYGADFAFFSMDSDRAVRRGGGWSDGVYAGLFYAFLYYDSADSYGGVGFRCCSGLG